MVLRNMGILGLGFAGFVPRCVWIAGGQVTVKGNTSSSAWATVEGSLMSLVGTVTS